MASALFSLSDGGGAATAVGGAAQPNGLNVTAGNVVNGQITDMVGVTGFQVRSVYNTAGLVDQNIVFTQNSATGAFSFPAGTQEGVGYVVRVDILTYTQTPAIAVSYAAVYVSAQGSMRLAFPLGSTMIQSQLNALLLTAYSTSQGPNQDPNVAFITNGSTTNAQGAGGPTNVALVQLVCKGSGVFDYMVSASAAGAGGDVVTWALQSQTGTGAAAYTGATAAPGLGGLYASGAAGTGIAITGGGGGALTQLSQVQTVGTAAVGAAFSASGTLHNSVVATVVTPFVRGQNVFFALQLTDSATNRAVSGISLSLRERLSS